MNNKILIEVIVPLLEENFEIYIPVNKRISTVIKLIEKSLNEITNGYYPTQKENSVIIDEESGSVFDVNLTVKESKKEENSDEEKNYIRRERSTREYSRSFYVGDVEPESIKASFKNGCLTVEVPKEEKKETKKLIQIEEK